MPNSRKWTDEQRSFAVVYDRRVSEPALVRQFNSHFSTSVDILDLRRLIASNRGKADSLLLAAQAYAWYSPPPSPNDKDYKRWIKYDRKESRRLASERNYERKIAWRGIPREKNNPQSKHDPSDNGKTAIQPEPKAKLGDVDDDKNSEPVIKIELLTDDESEETVHSSPPSPFSSRSRPVHASAQHTRSVSPLLERQRLPYSSEEPVTNSEENYERDEGAENGSEEERSQSKEKDWIGGSAEEGPEEGKSTSARVKEKKMEVEVWILDD